MAGGNATKRSANELSPAFLLGGFGVLTAALTALGAASGTINLVERNHPFAFIVGADLVVAAVCIGAFAQSAQPNAQFTYFRRTGSAYVGVATVGIALFLAGVHHYYWPRHDSKWLPLALGVALTVGGALWAFGCWYGPEETSESESHHRDSGPSPGRMVRAGPGRPWRVPAPIPEQSRPTPKRRTFKLPRAAVYRWGIAAFFVGMAFVTYAVVKATKDQPQPSVTASVSTGAKGPIVTVEVTDSDMSSNDHVQIQVTGISPPLRRADGTYITARTKRHRLRRLRTHNTQLYNAIVGPNESGNLDQHLTLPVASGFSFVLIRAWRVGKTKPRQCYQLPQQGDAATGCLAIRPPPGQPVPTLSASWASPGRAGLLNVHVIDHDLSLTTVHPTGRLKIYTPSVTLLSRPTRVSIRVTAGRAISSPRATLYSALLSPSELGVVDDSFSVLIAPPWTVVCVTARTVSPAANVSLVPVEQPTKRSCRARATPITTTWIRLTVPGRSPT